MPDHHARATVEYLCQATPELNFKSPDLWPPNSPDQNPAEWWLQHLGLSSGVDVCNANDFKQRLMEICPKIDQTLFQIIAVVYALLIHHSTGFRSDLLGGQRSGDMNSAVA